MNEKQIKTAECKPGIFPHYHRKGPAKANGETFAGQKKERHRPWESSKYDKSFKDRF